MTHAVTVVVADDHAVVRAGIVHIFGAADGFDVVGEADTAAAALAMVAALQPAVVVLDISMPDAPGTSVIPDIRRASPRTKVLVLSMYDDPEYIAESVRAGADGYVRKDTAATDLRNAVAAVLRGERSFPPFREREHKAVNLTARERQVLARVAAGRMTKEIAAELAISPRTVETYRENIARKIGIATVAGLTRYAIEHRISGE